MIDEARLRQRLAAMSDEEHSVIHGYLAALHAEAIKAIEQQTGMSLDANIDKLIAENPALAPRARAIVGSLDATLPFVPDVPVWSLRLKTMLAALRNANREGTT